MQFLKTISLIKQRTRFIQGFILGLFIMSALTYATVSLSTFTSGTTISSSAMNTNFTNISAKLDDIDDKIAIMEVELDAVLSSDFTITCGASMSVNQATDLMTVPLTSLVTNPNYSAGVYTVPVTGYYLVYLEAPATAASGLYVQDYHAGISVTSMSPDYYNMAYVPTMVKKFSAGQQITLKVGCGYKNTSNDTNPVIEATKLNFSIQKL